MNPSNIFTAAIIVTLVTIFISLGYGLFNLLISDHPTNKIVKALSYRIGLSLFLFAAVVFAIFQGWITPNPPSL